MKKISKPTSTGSGKYIVAKKNNRLYKVFLKDLKCIKMRTKKTLPPVPGFDEVRFVEKNTERMSEVDTEDGCESMEEERVELEAN